MKCPNCKKLHILKRPLCDKCYIAELEFKFSSKYWDEVGVEMMKIKAENKRLKATIKRVSELPKKWRVEVLGGIATRHDNVRDCADELEAILEQKDE